MRKALLAFIAVAASALSHGATLSVYLSAPAVQSNTFLTGAITEAFDALNVRPGQPQTMHSYTPPSGIGTYTMSGNNPNKFEVQDADQYGGAAASQYLSFGVQTGYAGPVSLALPGNYNYFGFWWSAGDQNNGISLYDNNNLLLGRFSTADIISILTPKTATVTSLDGLSRYMASSYYGNPTSAFLNQDNNEVFAYVSIITTGVTFNKIVLDNSGLTNTGFESDNHTIYAGQVEMLNSCPGCVLVKTVTAGAPEPGSAGYALIGGGAIAASAILKRLRRNISSVCANGPTPSAGR